MDYQQLSMGLYNIYIIVTNEIDYSRDLFYEQINLFFFSSNDSI